MRGAAATSSIPETDDEAEGTYRNSEGAEEPQQVRSIRKRGARSTPNKLVKSPIRHHSCSRAASLEKPAKKCDGCHPTCTTKAGCEAPAAGRFARGSTAVDLRRAGSRPAGLPAACSRRLLLPGIWTNDSMAMGPTPGAYVVRTSRGGDCRASSTTRQFSKVPASTVIDRPKPVMVARPPSMGQLAPARTGLLIRKSLDRALIALDSSARFARSRPVPPGSAASRSRPPAPPGCPGVRARRTPPGCARSLFPRHRPISTQARAGSIAGHPRAGVSVARPPASARSHRTASPRGTAQTPREAIVLRQAFTVVTIIAPGSMRQAGARGKATEVDCATGTAPGVVSGRRRAVDRDNQRRGRRIPA